MTPSITLERAGPDELIHLERVLEANGLPSEDVRAKPECFLVARSGTDETTVLGAGGIERDGTVGLLWSVVVVESRRGRGYGAALCDKLEEHAREEGVETLYLLTTTAVSFFEHRGYEEIARDEPPPSIQETTEFAELCPDSATCLRKRIQ